MEALIVYLERFPAACIASIPTTVRRRVTQLKLLGSCCAAKVFAIKMGIIDAVNDLRTKGKINGGQRQANKRKEGHTKDVSL